MADVQMPDASTSLVLPDELWLNVVSNLEPLSTDNKFDMRARTHALAALCRVNKQLRDIASVELYEQVTINMTYWRSPKWFIRTLINYPHLAQRVRRLRLYLFRRVKDSMAFPPSERRSFQEMCIAALSQIPLPHYLGQQLRNAVLTQNWGPDSAYLSNGNPASWHLDLETTLILALCPNIEELELEVATDYSLSHNLDGPGFYIDMTPQFVEHIATLGQRAPRVPLSQLQRLSVKDLSIRNTPTDATSLRHWKYRFDIEELSGFLRLPSLNIFEGDGIRWNAGKFDAGFQYPGVQFIQLSSVVIEEDDLQNALNSFPDLRQLSISPNRNGLRRLSSDTVFLQIGHALRQHGRQLESFSLPDWHVVPVQQQTIPRPPGLSPIGLLAELSNLVHLELPLTALLGSPANNTIFQPHHPINTYPPSLQSLELYLVPEHQGFQPGIVEAYLRSLLTSVADLTNLRGFSLDIPQALDLRTLLPDIEACGWNVLEKHVARPQGLLKKGRTELRLNM